MRPSRRKAIKQFATLFGTSALFGNLPASRGQQTSEASIEQYLDDPLLQPVHVRDFEPLAKAKLDPLAYDYLVGGSEDEVSLRDNQIWVRQDHYPAESPCRCSQNRSLRRDLWEEVGAPALPLALLEARIASIRTERIP